MEKNVSGITLCEGNEQSRQRRVVLNIVPMCVYYTNHFELVWRSIRRRDGVTNMLTDCLLAWENFLCHLGVEDGHTAAVLVLAFGLGEIATAQNLHPDSIEISRRGCGE